MKIEYGQLELCLLFERPTQRLLISHTIETEAKKAINLERDHYAVLYAIGELHGRGLVAMVCEIKMYEILLCGLIGQICENLHQ